MAGIISSGVGSGLDVTGLVSQLVAAERAPVENRLNSREALIQARLSAYGSLKSALSGFQDSLSRLKDVNTYLKRTATSSDSTIFTAAANTTASAGTYKVQVDQLAAQHKIASKAYTDGNTAIGTGTLTLTVNGDSFSLDIASTDGGDTVAGIRDAINNAANNVGVTASIVTDQDGAHLVLTSTETGADNAIKMEVSTDGSDTGSLADLVFDPALPANNPTMTQKQAALDSIVSVDGFTQTSSDLSVEGVIEGVTLNLKQADPGVSYDLTIKLDTVSVSSAVKDFIDSYNALRGKINELTAYNPETRVAGLLQGDSTTVSIVNQLRKELNAAAAGVSANVDSLPDIGITSKFSDGTLQLDAAKLSDALNSNFADFRELFAGSDGFAVRLDAVAETYTKLDGLLDNRTNGLKTEIDRIADQRDALNRRIAVIEARYLQQFSALDTLLGQLSQTSSFLSQQLQNLGNLTAGNK